MTCKLMLLTAYLMWTEQAINDNVYACKVLVPPNGGWHKIGFQSDQGFKVQVIAVAGAVAIALALAVAAVWYAKHHSCNIAAHRRGGIILAFNQTHGPKVQVAYMTMSPLLLSYVVVAQKKTLSLCPSGACERPRIQLICVHTCVGPITQNGLKQKEFQS